MTCDQLTDRARVERVRVERDPAALVEDVPERHAAERVEQRQHRCEGIALRERHDLSDRLTVRPEVLVGQHDAFGLTRAAAREQDRRRVVDAHAALRARAPLQHAEWEEQRSGKAGDPFEDRHPGHHVLEEQDLDIAEGLLDLCGQPLEESPRSQHRAEPGLPDRGRHRCASDGVVQRDGDPAREARGDR